MQTFTFAANADGSIRFWSNAPTDINEITLKYWNDFIMVITFMIMVSNTSCLDRWTVRADSMRSILNNYEYIIELMEQLCDESEDSNTRAQATGILSKLNDYKFL